MVSSACRENAVCVLDPCDDNDRSMRQVQALRELARKGAIQLPNDFDISMADPVWHDLFECPTAAKRSPPCGPASSHLRASA